MNDQVCVTAGFYFFLIKPEKNLCTGLITTTANCMISDKIKKNEEFIATLGKTLPGNFSIRVSASERI